MDAADDALLTAIAEIRQEFADLRAYVETGLTEIRRLYQDHITDSLTAVKVLANIQRRQALVGRATAAIGRAMLDDGQEEQSLSYLIDRIETDLASAPDELFVDHQE